MANGVKTLLDKLGSMVKVGAMRALGIEAKLLPAEYAVAGIVSEFDPPLGGTFEAILGGVVKVEQVATALNVSKGTGKQKLAAALPAVEDAILSNPLFKGKTISNLPLWNTAVEQIASAAAQLLNSVDNTEITVPAAPAAGATA